MNIGYSLTSASSKQLPPLPPDFPSNLQTDNYCSPPILFPPSVSLPNIQSNKLEFSSQFVFSSKLCQTDIYLQGFADLRHWFQAFALCLLLSNPFKGHKGGTLCKNTVWNKLANQNYHSLTDPHSTTVYEHYVRVGSGDAYKHKCI